MKKKQLLIRIAVVALAGGISAGCATSGMMKQDPKTLEDHCKEPKYKDAPICAYLSMREAQFAGLLEGFLETVRKARIIRAAAADCSNERQKLWENYAHCDVERLKVSNELEQKEALEK